MIPSLEGWPTKAKEAPSPHEVRLTPLDTNPEFQCLRANINLTDLSVKINEFTSKYEKVCSVLQQCKSLNSHLLTRIIELERNTVTNSQYSRRETVKLNPVPAEIHKDSFEESIFKALSLTGVKVVLEYLHAFIA